MIKFFSKPYRWAGIFSLLLVGLFTFELMDTFVLQKSMVIVASETSAETSTAAETEPVITATSYSDENIQISIETILKYDSTIYVADIQVSDGRTDESEGLSLLQLAQEFKERGCTIAYNLDGGGSSTMVFNGEVVNNPTDGRSIAEREVSDIVYFGY